MRRRRVYIYIVLRIWLYVYISICMHTRNNIIYYMHVYYVEKREKDVDGGKGGAAERNDPTRLIGMYFVYTHTYTHKRVRVCTK